jgi:hypothetical protein
MDRERVVVNDLRWMVGGQAEEMMKRGCGTGRVSVESRAKKKKERKENSKTAMGGAGGVKQAEGDMRGRVGGGGVTSCRARRGDVRGERQMCAADVAGWCPVWCSSSE